uniref:maleylpyruvate isomerase family mycothiol-dependent enzyme n=1 Tax=Nonomuraea pusilla TaxID=46177 RepID=UPI0006E14E1D|nr:maleylpyruvate isomerase family mycothiol-dependent enzyme [Nonomuraea pusilla]
MDYVAWFHREVAAVEAAALSVTGTAPEVPSCPGWSVSDLLVHLGGVHRWLAEIIRGRLTEPPGHTDVSVLALPADTEGWPRPESAPNLAPVPGGLVTWFAEGAAALESLFATTDPGLRVWTWSQEQSVGFWARMQAIEAAVHRWDAQNALGAAEPVGPELAADAVEQTFTVMAPARRAWRQAPPGEGERYAFRSTDRPGRWLVRFDGDEVLLTGSPDLPADVEAAGTVSDLMLFLWGRVPADRLQVTGDSSLLDRYFTLVPPL